MSDSPIQIRQDGSVLTVRLTHEETRNSLVPEIRDGLAEAVARAEDDPNIRALYITGQGKAFCAGGDFNMMKTQRDAWSTHQRFRRMSDFMIRLIRLPKPVVMGVNGAAVGAGMGIALAGDLVIAGESARFMAGFLRLGVVPDYGTLYTLPRLVGLARARNFLFSNGTWTAPQALDLGIVAQVTPDDALDETALAKAHELAAGPIEAMGMAKSLLSRAFESSLDDMLTFESLAQPLAYNTAAFQEGFDAINQKRKPDFPEASTKEPWHGHWRKAKDGE